MRLLIGLLASCIVFGGFTARLTYNDHQLQQADMQFRRDLKMLVQAVNDLALTENTNSTQSRTYREGAIRDAQVIRNEIAELRSMLAQVLSEL